MRAIVTTDYEARGDRETPPFNTSLSLKAKDVQQNLPKWAVEQAIAGGCAKPAPKKSDEE